MSSFLRIGKRLGQAARGEYGNDALLLHRGSIVLRDSTGVPVEHQLGAAGKFLGSDGTDLLDRYPPGYCLATDNGATVSTPSSETTVLSAGAIANAYPAGVAVGDMVHILAWGTWTPTGAQTCTLNLYMGTTVIATYTSASFSATLRNWLVDVRVPYTIIGGAGAGQIRPWGSIIIGGGGGAGFDSLSAASGLGFGGNVTTIATNAASNLDLKVSLSNSSGSVVGEFLTALYYPKNR